MTGKRQSIEEIVDDATMRTGAFIFAEIRKTLQADVYVALERYHQERRERQWRRVKAALMGAVIHHPGKLVSGAAALVSWLWYLVTHHWQK